MCFTLAFMLIRKFGGGYHAKRTWVCMISSSVAMVAGSCLAQWVVIPFAVLTPMIVAAGVEIWINSPIDLGEPAINPGGKKGLQTDGKMA